MHRLSGLLAGLVFILLATAGCVSFSPTVSVVHDAVYPAAGLAIFQLENQNGYVTVTGWDQDQVQVRALNGRQVSNVSVAVFGDRMTVRTLSASPVGIGMQLDYEIRVPRALQRVELASANGRIEVDDYNGTIDAETSNGAIRLTGTRTFERLSTSNGRIDAEVRSLDADALATTSNGAVRILISPSVNATVDARTSNGRIAVSGLALNATSTGQNQVTGTLGTGGNTLRVETSNGEITLGPL
ncbi:MAG: DUF4097 family beta strand repeat-containing protein [Methanospirillum sp.]